MTLALETKLRGGPLTHWDLRAKGRNSPLYLMALLGKQDSLSLREQFLVWDLGVREDPSPPLWVV